MTDLSREELRAHLSAVEAQVRAALRIVAAESKSVQQAHSALRADLSAALIRLQSEMNDGNKRVDGKVDRVISEVNGLSRQRRLTASILTTMVLLFGITLGLFAGGGWYLMNSNGMATLPLELQSLAPAAAPVFSPASELSSGSGTTIEIGPTAPSAASSSVSQSATQEGTAPATASGEAPPQRIFSAQ